MSRSSSMVSIWGSPYIESRWLIPYLIAYTGKVRLKGVPFFRLQVYEREGISLVEVCHKVEKSVISASKMGKIFWFCDLFISERNVRLHNS